MKRYLFVVVCALLASSCSHSRSSRPSTATATGPQRVLARDDFRRSDRLLTGDRTPTGQTYRSDIFTHQHAAIRDHRFVASDPNGYGKDGSHGVNGSAAIGFSLSPAPTLLSATFTFEPGSTAGESAVISAGSNGLVPAIQFAIWPDRWQVFAPHGPAPIKYDVFGKGRVSPPLATGASKQHTASIEFDSKRSQVRVRIDAGAWHVVQNRAIAGWWGATAVFQTRRPLATDGRVEFLKIEARGR